MALVFLHSGRLLLRISARVADFFRKILVRWIRRVRLTTSGLRLLPIVAEIGYSRVTEGFGGSGGQGLGFRASGGLEFELSTQCTRSQAVSKP